MKNQLGRPFDALLRESMSGRGEGRVFTMTYGGFEPRGIALVGKYPHLRFREFWFRCARVLRHFLRINLATTLNQAPGRDNT